MPKAVDTPDKVAPVRQLSPFQKWLGILEIEAQDEDRSAKTLDIIDDVVSRILMAEDLDAAVVEMEKGIPSGKDLVDVEMSLTDFDVMRGSLEEANFKYYLMCTATRLDTGEIIRFTVGAAMVVSWFWKARNSDGLPLLCVMRGKDLGGGKVLLMPKRIPARAMNAA